MTTDVDEASLEAEVRTLRAILLKLYGRELIQAPDGWYAVESIPTRASGHWMRFTAAEQTALHRTYRGYENAKYLDSGR